MKTTDGKMVSLLSHAHLFTLKEVIAEHIARMTHHSPAYDRRGIETAASLVLGYGKYDSYDKLDCRISRLAMESIIGTTLQEDIETRYSHLDDFHALPGSVYFMMALEASNASVSHDIDDATDKFLALSLSAYPGENVKGLATEALRLIKIMEGGYSLPIRLGSDLLRKVYNTSSESFNRWVHAKLDDVRKMELTYKLKDPKLMMSDNLYSTLGPIALCGFLQESYGSLVTEKAWPALTEILPVSNYTPIASPEPKPRICYYCKATDHTKQDCPKLAAKRNRQKEGNKEGNKEPPTPSTNPSSSSSNAPFASWRYIEPANPTVAITMDGVTYKWCKECRCRATGHQGYYTTTHFTTDHIKRNVSFSTPSANHSSILPLASTIGEDVFTSDSIPPEERLVFTGPWHCEVEVESDNAISDIALGKDSAVVHDVGDAFVSTAGFSIWTLEIPNLPETDGVESIAFTHDEDHIAATVMTLGHTNADAIIPGQTMGPSDVPIATPILPSLPGPQLLVDTTYSCIFDTCPPLSIIDLEYTELRPCDNAPCCSIGPPGFNCVTCNIGVYHTALVRCRSCLGSTGFLGDICPQCGSLLYGVPIVQSGLPGQKLIDFVDMDASHFMERNFSRARFYFTGSEFLPVPSVNCAPCLFQWDVASFHQSVGEDVYVDCVDDASSVHPSLDCADVAYENVFVARQPDHESTVVSPIAVYLAPSLASTTSFLGVRYMQCLQLMASLWCFLSWSFGHAVSIPVLVTRRLCFWAFLVGTLWWDLLELFYLAPHVCPMPPRCRRRSKVKFASLFPRHWMLLSSLMLVSGFRSVTAFTLTTAPWLRTLTSCVELESRVHLSPLVLYDLHCYRAQIFFTHLHGSLVGRSSHSGQLQLGGSLFERSHSATFAATSCINQPSSSDNQCPHASLSMYHDAYSDLPSLDLFGLDYLSADTIDLDCRESGPITHVTPSAPGLNAALTGINGFGDFSPLTSLTVPVSRFPVIFDSGASIAITGNKHDFVGPLKSPPPNLTIGGMAQGAKVEGIGLVRWKFKTPTGAMVLSVTCYYVPSCRARLLSPQRLFNKQKGITGSFSVEEDHATLNINDHPSLIIEYESTTFLPVGLAWNADQSAQVIHPSVNLSITEDENQNLTPAQKLLLTWHYRFGHRNFPFVQHLLKLPIFNGAKFVSAAKAAIPKCAICEYAKAHARSTAGNKTSTNLNTDGALKDGHLRPGSKVSADHFESRLKGRTYSSFGKTTSDQYVGGCIFVDHMSGYIHVEHQLGFSSSETIRAKQNYEQMALAHGVLVEDYLTDNGVFSKTKFVDHIRQHNQQIHYCGVNAHHKNSVAERAIRTVSELARALLLHASTHWPDGLDGTLWPMAVDHAVYLYNTLPTSHGICPADLFTGTTVPCHKLRDLHVWGCPVFVLDPTLQQGKKLPRWQPRSRRGVFLGYSPFHSSDVPLVLNLQTGSISPQFHVVFDDAFTTVHSISEDTPPPEFWTAANVESCIYRVPVDTDDPSVSLLPDDWLTPTELEEKRRNDQRRLRIRSSFEHQSPVVLPPEESSVPPVASVIDPPLIVTSPLPTTVTSPPAPMPVTLPVHAPQPSTLPVASTPQPGNVPHSPLPSRRSARANKGTFLSTKYIDEVYNSTISTTACTSHDSALSYHTDLHTDLDTGELNYFEPHAYAAKVKKHDPDNPTYMEAMSGNDAQYYIEAMQQEVLALLQQRTWIRIDRRTVPVGQKILKGTWAFKLKRLPDGTPLKYKARYCCRGDMQTEGVDYFDTYAPVIQWSTVRLVLTLTLKHGWSTRQVDYTNAFAQAEIQEEVYIEPPRGFSGQDGLNKVLKLCKSLYGLKQAPKTFFDKLRAGLLERGFTPSNIDPCLFMKGDMICVVYVDDTILCGPSSDALEAEIRGLGVNNLEQRHAFQLRNEGEVGDFLGIRIEKERNGNFKLTQTGLIDKVIAAADMIDCNAIATPTSKEALGSDKDGEPMSEKWKYSTVVGMLLYLSGNTRPDITFAVHQCARYSHCPKQSHAKAVKRIIRYLKGTKDKGMTFSPTSEYLVDCYVDADFAGLWGIEYDQDPVSVKSRTGYLIMFMGCPLLWASKLQTQIALSTMEAEYIALSTAMRELIAIREVLKEIRTLVFGILNPLSNSPAYSMTAKTFVPIVPSSQIYEDNEACLKFATLPKMSPRTKHIAIPYHFFRSKVENLEIKVLPIDTTNQLADQFTKGLREDDFIKARKCVLGW